MIVCRFLLVSLHIEAILGEVTIRRRRKKLEEMMLGNGLSDAYTASLTRLKSQKGYKSVLGLKVLMWVLYSERPLRVQELCEALGVEIGSADLDPEDVPALRILVSSCLGLVTVEASSSTVRLVHFTLQEHLLTDPTLFHSPHSTIAEVCLTYLNFRCIKDLSPTLRSAPATTPLLEYASIYWGRHAIRGMTENIKILALRLLDEFDKHISAQLLLLHQYLNHGGLYVYEAGGSTGFTGLHGAAFLGIVKEVPSVLGMKKWDVNAADCTGMTALTWAAGRGHEEVVEMLLDREDINPDQPDAKYGRTPLSLAARNGHDRIVGMLLKQEDVNPDQPDTEYGRTPLLWATKNGHDGIVKILLERDDVNPSQADTFYGRTPLLWAAGNGHEEVVNLLMEQNDDVRTAMPDHMNQTPRPLACSEGHDGVVKIPGEQGNVNCTVTDRGGPASLLPSAVPQDQYLVGMQFRSHDPNTDMTGVNGQPAPLPPAHHEQPRLLDLGDSISKSGDSDLSTQSS